MTAPRTRRERIAIVLVPSLSILLLVLLVRPSGKPAGPVKSAPASEVAAAAPAEVVARTWQRPEAVPDALRDPMYFAPKPVEVAKKDEPIKEVDVGPLGKPGGLPIGGIVYSDDKPCLIADGKLVRKGEVVRGTKIVDITNRSVELERDGEHWTVQVRPDPVKN